MPPAVAARPWFYGYRIHQGQTLHLRYISNVVATLRAWVRVIYDDGSEQLLTVPDEDASSDRVATEAPRGEVATADGWVVGAAVEVSVVTLPVVRGQTYVKLQFEPFGVVLCADYCYTDAPVVLGTFVQPGPGGGSGHLYWRAIKADGVPATFSFTFALSNQIRLVREFAWYYAASNTVATRIIQILLRTPGGGTPTGYGTGDLLNVFESPTVTLTSDEDGSLFIDEERIGVNDNGTVTISDVTTVPSPLPILISEDDTRVLRGVVTAPEADDFDAVWGLFEDWVVLQGLT